MNGTRLATLTLTGALLVTTPGCFNLFERFQAWRYTSAADCTCMDSAGPHGATVPAGIEVPGPGPVLITPDVPPPPTQTPTGPPPRIVPIPATPMPWSGQQ
jgi:hypothetical protein